MTPYRQPRRFRNLEETIHAEGWFTMAVLDDGTSVISTAPDRVFTHNCTKLFQQMMGSKDRELVPEDSGRFNMSQESFNTVVGVLKHAFHVSGHVGMLTSRRRGHLAFNPRVP